MGKIGRAALLTLVAATLYGSQSASPDTTHTVAFSSEKAFEEAVAPLSPEEVLQKVAASGKTLTCLYDPSMAQSENWPVGRPQVGDLLHTKLFNTGALTVFYPETPRVPHHLTLAFNRKEIQGLSSLTPEENRELFAIIKKIAEIYKTVSVQGFVIAQYDTPQEGHQGRCVVELIPHLPGFHHLKNNVDKVDSNRHVLFRTAPFLPIHYEIKPEAVVSQAAFWQTALRKEYPPLMDTETALPSTRRESYEAEANRILMDQFLTLLQAKGGTILSSEPFKAVMPTEVPSEMRTIPVTKCVFCDPAIIQQQLIYEYRDILVFYNARQGARPGSCFLLLPKRHTQKVYGLQPHEIDAIGLVRKALTELMKEVDPRFQVVVYNQDDPAVGQTVFHSHEQLLAIDPQSIAWTWTLMSLHAVSNVSNAEMERVRQEVGPKLAKKIEEIEKR